MLSSHSSSALQYRFLEINCGAIALIVDWIECRQGNQHVLRVSIHSPYGREIIGKELAALMTCGWGTPAQLRSGYLYLNQRDKREFVMAPLNLTRVTGTPDEFQLEINCIGKENITLTAKGREYGDFGNRIINTFTGDLEIQEENRVIARTIGTAGLERRFPDHAVTRRRLNAVTH